MPSPKDNVRIPQAPTHDADGDLVRAAETHHLTPLFYLWAAQMDAALDEAQEGFDTLTNSFLTVAGHARTVSDRVSSQDMGDTIVESSAEISSQIRASLTTFQLFDRLRQRLGNVRHCLVALGEYMNEEADEQSTANLQRFLAQVREQYTTEAEREMFDSIFGASLTTKTGDPAQTTGELLTESLVNGGRKDA